MVDTPSSILLLRLQATGSNTNLWGGYLNTAMQMIEQASKGYQAQAVTGDATISWTNYTTGNIGSAALLKLTGALTAAATLTMPAYMNFLLVWNNAGAAVTLKCSGGTGVSVPTGRKTFLFCDGVDYYPASSLWISDYASTLTNAGDIVVKTTLETAITALTTAQSGLVLVDSGDTTAQYLATKLAFSGDVSGAATGAGAKTYTITVNAKKIALAMSMALGVPNG